MRLSSWALAALATTLIGCSGGGKGPASPAVHIPDAVDLESSALPGGDAMPGLAGTSVLGGYTWRVDPSANQATVEGWRAGTQTDDIYHLSVDAFFQARNLRITGISRTATTLDISYEVSHPFNGPVNPTAPATAANRADLGIAARMLFLLDIPAAADPADYTYFGGEAIANTRLIGNADGFYQPRGLLTNTGGLSTNTFPYKLLVDEAAGAEGNRVGIGNGGAGIGNYRPTEGGWQLGTLSFSGQNNGWTGYDVLHQGQAASSVVSLNLAEIGASGFSFDTAVVAKYLDPRGGTTSTQKRANRLPANPFDVTKFVYRMPLGALDCSLVRSLGESGGLVANSPTSTTTVRFHVRDFDARALETTRPDVSEDTDPTTVHVGSSGVPTVTIDVPGVSNSPATLAVADDDTAYGGDAGQDSGIARDPLFFEGTVFNSAGTSGQVNGTMYGLLKIEDPENLIDRSGYEFALDPNLTPLTSNQPAVVTYQAANVEIGGTGGNNPPTATVVLQGGPNPVVPSGGSLIFEVSAEFDTENNPVLYDIDETNNASFEVTMLDPAGVPPPNVLLYTGTAPANTGATNVAYQARVNYYDAGSAGAPSTLLLDYEVAPAGANTPPTASVSLANTSIASGGTLTFDLNSEFDADGDTVTYGIDYDYTGVYAPNVSGLDPAAPPTVLNTSPAQVGGATPSNRTARVQYTDGVNAPINIDLNYTVGPASCGTASMTFNFDTGSQGWVEGQNFVYGAALKNTDALNWGHFRHNGFGGAGACVPTSAEGAGISQGYLVSGDDGDSSTCSYLCDYNADGATDSAEFNMISPFINVPPICVPGSLQVSFNAYMDGASGANARLFVSTDLGATWGTAVWTQPANGTAQALGNVVANLNDTIAGQSIFLRFQFEDAVTVGSWRPGGGASCSSTGADNVGLVIDNVVISEGTTGVFTNSPPTFPCQPRTQTFSFDVGSGGWASGLAFPSIGYNTDDLGWGSFRWTDCDNTEFGGTYAAVETASGGAISDSSLNTTNDGTGSGCGSFLDDYGGNPNYNVVSPQIIIPANCGGGDTVTLLWNAYLNVDDSNDPGDTDGWDSTVQVRAYLSTDNGATWGGVPVWSAPATQAGQTWLNQSLPVTAYAGSANGIRIRFQMQGSRSVTQNDVDGDPFGFYVDNVRLQSTNTDGIYLIQ